MDSAASPLFNCVAGFLDGSVYGILDANHDGSGPSDSFLLDLKT
jgi:hypothetical protein